MSPLPPSCEQVPIALGERSYPILIGAGLLDAPAAWSAVPASAQALVVTNTTVEPLYAERLVHAIARRHGNVHVLALPDGEEHKSWPTLQRIFDELLAKECDR